MKFKTESLIFPGCTRLSRHYQPKEISKTADLSVDSRVENYPKISIVVPSYNQGRFIGKTLESVISQAYPNLELIVVDGGSKDSTVEVIEQYASHIKWWVSESDEGQGSAINKGMSHATGEVLAWLNSDDCLMPGALFRVADRFMKSPDIDVVYGHRVLIDDDGMDVGKWIMPAHRRLILTYADFIPQETMFWRSELPKPSSS